MTRTPKPSNFPVARPTPGRPPRRPDLRCSGPWWRTSRRGAPWQESGCCASSPCSPPPATVVTASTLRGGGRHRVDDRRQHHADVGRDLPASRLCSSNDVSRAIEDLQYTLEKARASTRIDRTARCSSPISPTPVSPAGPRSRPGARGRGPGGVRLPGAGRRRAHGRAQPLPRPARRARRPINTPTRWSWPTSPPGPSSPCSPRVRSGQDRAASWRPARTSASSVHQASGMVAAQLGVSVGDALARLRAYAFSHDLAARRRRNGCRRAPNTVRQHRGSEILDRLN